jgi:hypothetical protein
MLFYKGWLETRWRLAFGLGIPLFAALSVRSRGQIPNVEAFLTSILMLWVVSSILSGGSGIQTQSGSLRPQRGEHGSTLFTLSLPVSRTRLFGTRVLFGFGLTTALSVVNGILFQQLIPQIGDRMTAVDAAKFGLAMAVCCAPFYFLSCLLSTQLDGVWQMYGSMAISGVSAWLSDRLGVPDQVNIFLALATRTPFLTHEIPWSLVATSASLAAALFAAGWLVIERREY